MSHSHFPRVRFSPSPTGFLHVGGLRTALYNYLFARKQGGVFLLRIEDTDQKRFVSGATESLVRTLRQMGIEADEGVIASGEGIVERGSHGPYVQSARLPLYQDMAATLLTAGKAYPCFCSPDRLQEIRAAQEAAKQAPRYDGSCSVLAPDEAARRREAGEPHVIRYRIPEGSSEIRCHDLIRGELPFAAVTLDDFVLLKSDGFPTYHLASVVDDHAMAITHVIRGEEWLPSFPKHILLYRALGWEAPLFAHLPLLLNPDRSKLSKRKGDVSVESFLTRGFLPEALLNFVALLGWNPGQGSRQELYSLEELVRAFEISRIHKGGAIFDVQKLQWMNQKYIQKLAPEELFRRVSDGGFFGKNLIQSAPESLRTPASLRRLLAVEQERLTTLADVGELNPFFFHLEPDYPAERLNWKTNTSSETRQALEQALHLLSALPFAGWEDRAQLNDLLLQEAGDKRGDFLWPLRVALTGAERSPSPSDCAFVLGRQETLRRVERALKRLV